MGVGPAPDWFDEEEKRAWDELVSLAQPGKWLKIYSMGIEMMATLLVQCRCKYAPSEMHDSLAESFSLNLLGPEHYEQLIGKKYPKAWPDPNE